MIRRAIIALVAALAMSLIGGPPAQAHHAGPYVANSDNEGHRVIIRDHTWGTQAWHFLYPGQFSARGATGIKVKHQSRLIIRSVTTGTIYHTACGDWYAGHGYTWRYEPYVPVPPDRSIQILDEHDYPYGIAASCG